MILLKNYFVDKLFEICNGLVMKGELGYENVASHSSFTSERY